MLLEVVVIAFLGWAWTGEGNWKVCCRGLWTHSCSGVEGTGQTVRTRGRCGAKGSIQRVGTRGSSGTQGSIQGVGSRGWFGAVRAVRGAGIERSA